MRESKVSNGRAAPGQQAPTRQRAVVLASSIGPVQTRLEVGAAGDPYEREADEVAATVVREIARREEEPPPVDASGAPRIRRAPQRRSVAQPPSAPRVRRRVAEGTIGPEGGALDADTERRIERARGHGTPLDEPVRRSMEDGFGADFGAVRVHADEGADRLTTRIQAKAFTTGNDIFFQQSQYDPSSTDGQELLAHELAHVVQQGPGVGRVVRRAIDQKQVADMSRYLGIEAEPQVVEVPKDTKIRTTTPFSAYPATSKLNLSSALESKSIILLNFPDWETNPEYDADFKAYYADQPATAVTDGLGGGAYNHTMDLVVLREPYTVPELLHEMGHKAQADAGITADTATVLLLEYQNVILHQNSPWWLRKPDAEPPRLQYSSTGISASKIKKTYGISKPSEMTPEIWKRFKQAAVTAVHHTHTEAEGVLDSIESSLAGRYSEESDQKGRFDQQVMFNLIAEYLDKQS